MSYGSERTYRLQDPAPKRVPARPSRPPAPHNGDLLVLRAQATALLRKHFPAGDYFRFLARTLGPGNAEIANLSRFQLQVVIETLSGGWHQKVAGGEKGQPEPPQAQGTPFLAGVALLVLLLAGPAWAWTDTQVADAIYQTEGGARTRFPYGVKSIDTRGDPALARKITLNSIRNSRQRWEKAGRPGDWLDFMASRWCPKSADPVGHKNWLSNMRRILR